MSHREKSSASCDRDSDKYCTENCDSDTDEEKLKREMDRIRKELGELSKEEAKKYDSCRKDRGTKKEFAEKRFVDKNLFNWRNKSWIAKIDIDEEKSIV